MTTPPRAVYWTSGGHNVWRRTFEQLNPGSGNLVDTIGMTAYNWALQFSAAASSLPVVWKDFTATLTGSAVQLKWIITNQENVNYYVIQRSTDGNNFQDIGRIAPLTGGGQLIYQHSDQAPPEGDVYYRIYQTDFDGRSGYSAIRKIHVNLSKATFHAFPNPFREQLKINLRQSSGQIEVKLQDAQGRVLKKNTFHNANSSQQEIVLNGLDHLGTGIYYVVITGADGKMLARIPVLKK